MKTLIKTKKEIIVRDTVPGTLQYSHVRIQVKEVGLCRTDLYVADGTIPVDKDIILGHEFSGVIIASNSPNFLIGERVSLNPLFDTKFMGLDFDGCLRETIDVPASQVIKAYDLDFKTAAYLEPVAASMAVLKVCKDKEAKGAVFGYNRIAELTYLILKTEGYNVEWLDEKQAYGEETHNQYDYIVETLFHEEDLKTIIKLLKKEGTLVVKSRKKSLTGLISSDLVAKELTLRCVNYYDFNNTMAWLTQNKNVVAHLLGHSYPFEEWRAAFDEAYKGESKKIFIHL